jgi:dihydrofolate reductase
MRLTLIAAIAQNEAIGKENALIWHLSEDLKRFKQLTLGHHLIMGRKTFESIGRPLPGRTTIVVSRQIDYDAKGAIVVNSLEDAIHKASGDTRPFIAGGAALYRQALPYVQEMEITRLDRDFEADAFFPEVSWDQWLLVEKESHTTETGLPYHFCRYVRKTLV